MIAAWARRSPERATLLLVVAVGLALRLYRLGNLSLWTDEGFTYWATLQSFAYIWHFIPSFDSHPPLFYTLLKLWTALFGTSEAGLRSLSVAASVATIPVLWLAGRMLGGERDGRWVGLAAATLAALSPVQIEYAQEARPYALLILAAAVAITGALWLTLHPAQARRPLLGWGGGSEGGEAAGAKHARAAWAALVGGAALAPWLHNLGAFLVISLGFAGAFWVWRDQRWDRHAIANGALAMGLVFLIWLPYLIDFVAQSETFAQDLWIPAPTWDYWRRTLDFLFSVRFLRHPKTFWWLFSAGLLGLLALVLRRKASSAAFLLAITVAGPIALSLLVSYAVRPIFLDRTLLAVTAPYYLAVAAALVLLPRRPWLRAVPVAAAVAALLAGDWRYYDDFKKEPWRHVTEELVRRWEPNDLLVVMPEFQKVLTDYYAAREGRELRSLELPVRRDHPPPSIGGPPAIMTLSKVGEADIKALRAAVSPDGRVWLVLRRDDLYDPGGLTRRFLEGQRRPLLEDRPLFQRHLRLYLYGAPAPAGIAGP